MSATPGRQTKEWTGLPVLPSRMALIELGVLVAVILLERFVDPFPDLSRMNPHPYWIFVLLLSLQYGTVSGLLAAIVSIIGTIVLGLPEADIGESYFEYLVRVWTQPVLWLVMALMLGSFRMRQIEFRDDLLREVDDLQSRGVALVDHAKHLKARCDALERELAASADPEAQRVLDAVARLARVSEGDGEAAFRSAMSLAFPNAQASVFLVRPDGWSLAYSSGWPERARWKTSFGPSEPLVEAVAVERRALSILAAKDDAVLAGQGQFAVPILADGGARTVGFVKVEAMPAAQIGPATVERLSLVARQLGLSLGRDIAAGAPAQPAREPSLAQQGLSAAVRYLPRIRWRSGNEVTAQPADTAPASGDASPRSYLRRT